MYPTYRYVGSCPQTWHPRGDQVSHPHVYPSWEAPFNGTLSYSGSGECNGSWNHGYPPHYTVGPYPHPQPPQHYSHGPYPPYANIHPPYFVPPPWYLPDQGRSHCCGCPNHSCQRRNNSDLKIEEAKPGIESKNNASYDVVQWPGYPYPLVWLPPDHMKDNDDKTFKLKDDGPSTMIKWPAYPYPLFHLPPKFHMKHNDPKAELQKDGPLDGWIPLGIDSLKPFRENGEKKIQNQEDRAAEMQLPLPIIWMPDHDQSQEVNKKIDDGNLSPKAEEELPSKFRIIPFNHLDNYEHNEKPFRENEEKKTQNQQNRFKRTQLPLPAFWMPTYEESQGADKNVNYVDAGSKVAEELPSTFRIIPVNHLEGDDCNEKPGVEGVNPDSQMHPTLLNKGGKHKSIPVKQMEESGPKRLDDPEQKDLRAEKFSSSEKKKEETCERKPSYDSTKKEGSPGKSSKLPPVCLRVDPLPWKRTGNGSSRSPSPSEKKEDKVNKESKESKAGGSDGLKDSKKDGTMDKEIRIAEPDGRSSSRSQKVGTGNKVRIVEVEDRSTSKREEDGKNQDKSHLDFMENHSGKGIEVVAEEDKSENMVKLMQDEKNGNLKSNEEVNLGNFKDHSDESKNTTESSDEKKKEENMARIVKFSETDAVLRIQSAYRGYQVRKWEPLKKLKQMARVRDQVNSVKQQIHGLELEGGRLDEKQKLFIGETIMSLLLQLDTVQGLHPSVRETRKTIARDLVSLQEKLDMLSVRAAERLRVAEHPPPSGDFRNALEDVQCDGASNLVTHSFTQQEPSQPSDVNMLDSSSAGKQEVAGSDEESSTGLLLGDHAAKNSISNNQLLLPRISDKLLGYRDEDSMRDIQNMLPEIRDEQAPNSVTGLTLRSQFETEEPCYFETEEYMKSPTACDVEIDSIADHMPESPTKEENSHAIIEEPQGPQQGVQDQTVQTPPGKEDPPAEPEIFIGEDKKAEVGPREHDEMQAMQVQQPAVDTSAIGAVILQQQKDVLQEEPASVIKDLLSIQVSEPAAPNSNASEVLQECEDSVSGNEASMVQNVVEHSLGPVDLLEDDLENAYYTESGAAGSRSFPSSDFTIPGIDVDGSDVKTVLEEKQEFKEPLLPESIDTEVVNAEGNAPAPLPGTGLDLAEDGNRHTPPAPLAEENTSQEEEEEEHVLDVKDEGTVPSNSIDDSTEPSPLPGASGSGDETVCPTKPTSSTGASLGSKGPGPQQASVSDMENERNLMEEDGKLREMLEKLLEAGNKQMVMISGLSGRVKDLEKKVARRRTLRIKKHRASVREAV